MPDLQLLRSDHAAAVLTFEVANRAYFAASVSDRGDAYFAGFDRRFDELLAAQQAGEGAFHVLCTDDGAVAGRFNLEFAREGTAVLGFRMAQAVTGRGWATAAVRDLADTADARHGVRILRAAAATTNTASRRVLDRTGFHIAEPAAPAALGGRPGHWYERDLLAPTTPTT